MPKCHLQRPVYDIPHYKQNHPVLKQKRTAYQVHTLIRTLLHVLMVMTHNVHRSRALSDAVCVNDSAYPPQHPRV